MIEVRSSAYGLGRPPCCGPGGAVRAGDDPPGATNVVLSYSEGRAYLNWIAERVHRFDAEVQAWMSQGPVAVANALTWSANVRGPGSSDGIAPIGWPGWQDQFRAYQRHYDECAPTFPLKPWHAWTCADVGGEHTKAWHRALIDLRAQAVARGMSATPIASVPEHGIGNAVPTVQAGTDFLKAGAWLLGGIAALMLIKEVRK